MERPGAGAQRFGHAGMVQLVAEDRSQHGGQSLDDAQVGHETGIEQQRLAQGPQARDLRFQFQVRRQAAAQ